MDYFTILNQNDGMWKYNNYINYVVNAIIVNFDYDSEDLIIIVSTEINVDSTIYFMEIKCVLTDQISVILIYNML